MTQWLVSLVQSQSEACTIMMIALVIAGGLFLGGLRLRGIGLGSSGVLFIGIIVGFISPALDPVVLSFLKDFGLVLFVFTIGLQLGPGFASSLRAEGLRLNLLAAAVVLIGSLIAACAIWSMPLQPAGILGALSGAVTNTPSLGATEQALQGIPETMPRTAGLPAIAYAVAYPGGIAGIIASLLILRWWLRVDVSDDAFVYANEMKGGHEPFERRTLRVENPMLEGLAIERIPGLRESGVTISRIRGGADREVRTISPATMASLGDRLLVVGPRRALDHFQPVVGNEVDEDLVDAPGRAAFSRMVVTSHEAAGHLLGSLRLGERFCVTVTRVQRAGIEMTPDSGLRLHFGDVLFIVGERLALDQAAMVVGNHAQELNATHFASIFFGIAIGVAVGTVPIAIPGLPAPVRLGLAGGPLLVAIALGRLGSLGRLVWHMPEVANRTLREFGISLFLAGVGLFAGPAFFATVVTADGILWVVLGLLITMVPLVSVGWFARRMLRMNYMRISGLLAGSMTDPPALAFANSIAGSEGPSTSYATVYPLTMLLRIIIAQVLVVLFCHSR